MSCTSRRGAGTSFTPAGGRPCASSASSTASGIDRWWRAKRSSSPWPLTRPSLGCSAPCFHRADPLGRRPPGHRRGRAASCRGCPSIPEDRPVTTPRVRRNRTSIPSGPIRQGGAIHTDYWIERAMGGMSSAPSGMKCASVRGAKSPAHRLFRAVHPHCSHRPAAMLRHASQLSRSPGQVARSLRVRRWQRVCCSSTLESHCFVEHALGRVGSRDESLIAVRGGSPQEDA